MAWQAGKKEDVGFKGLGGVLSTDKNFSWTTEKYGLSPNQLPGDIWLREVPTVQHGGSGSVTTYAHASTIAANNDFITEYSTSNPVRLVREDSNQGGSTQSHNNTLWMARDAVNGNRLRNWISPYNHLDSTGAISLGYTVKLYKDNGSGAIDTSTETDLSEVSMFFYYKEGALVFDASDDPVDNSWQTNSGQQLWLVGFRYTGPTYQPSGTPGDGKVIAYNDNSGSADASTHYLEWVNQTANTATNIVVTDDENTSANQAIIFVNDLDGSTGTGLKSDGDFYYNPSTGTVTATNFSGSFANALMDSDFGSNGLMKRTGAGTYTTISDNSSNWNTAYGWGDHSTAGYSTANTMGTGFTVSATTDSNATTITQGDDLFFEAGTGITCETSADGTVKISSTVSGGATEVNDLSDVDTSGSEAPSVNDVLKWNGSNWVPAVYNATFTFSVAYNRLDTPDTGTASATLVLMGSGQYQSSIVHDIGYTNGPSGAFASAPTVARSGHTPSGGATGGYPLTTTSNGTVATSTALNYPSTLGATYYAYYRFIVTATHGGVTDSNGPAYNIYFRNKKFFGPQAASSLTSAQVIGLSNSDWMKSSSSNTSTDVYTQAEVSITCNNQYVYYCYPSRISGTPTFKINGFTTPFTDIASSSPLSVTNASGFTETYKVWQSENPYGTTGAATLTFQVI